MNLIVTTLIYGNGARNNITKAAGIYKQLQIRLLHLTFHVITQLHPFHLEK